VAAPQADFDASGCPEELQVILRAMQKHGLILADNGTLMFVSGAPDDRWDNDMLAFLREINAHDFEALDVFSLIVDPDSGQVRHKARSPRGRGGDARSHGTFGVTALKEGT